MQDQSTFVDLGEKPEFSNLSDLLKLVKDETKRKYGERNILSAFIRFVKFSKVRSPCLDSHSFSLYLHAIGISTVPLKSNIEEGPSNLTMLEQLFKAFD